MANFKNYYIFPKEESFNKLKEDFIRSNDSYSLCSIFSSKLDWYNYKNGIYRVTDIEDFNIEFLKGNILSMNLIHDFIRLGLSSGFQLNGVDYQEKKYFILSWASAIKEDEGFFFKQAALINEDIYNIYMIKAKRFLLTTTPNDLSRYSDFFVVCNMDGHSISTNSIEQEYNNGIITLEEMNNRINILETQERAILSLKK